MSFLDSLPPQALALVEQNLEPRRFREGECIIKQGDPGDGAYLIDEGRVRIEFDTGETDTEIVLRYLEPGAVMGEFALVDGAPRSANAYAHTDVATRWLPTARFQALCDQNPSVGVMLLASFCQNLAQMVRQYTERVADFASPDKRPPLVDETVARAVAAQKAFEDWPEARVDALLQDVASAVAERAGELAAACVQETGLGVAADKVLKIRFASLEVCKVLVGRPAAGFLLSDEQSHVLEFASPVGVVLGIIPLTNPVSTIVFKTLICVKSRNALILSCHRNALGVGNRTGEIVQAVLQKHGAPVDLVQWIRERTSRRLTDMFMRHPDVSFILATGGPSIVKAAYSSGTPAIGVGAGNAPVWVCRDADPEAVAQMVVRSKSFDNGIICGSENNLVVDTAVRERFIAALQAQGAAVLTPAEIARFTERIFDPETGHPRREVIGQSAHSIAQRAGIQRDYAIRLIVAPVETEQVEGPYGREKLAPILSLFTVSGEADGLALCKRILEGEGLGHTAVIHTHDEALARRFGREMPVSRILVNSSAAQGCIGIGTGLTPSLTLGCGTWGSTSTTDNVTYRNVLNIKRVAWAL